MKKMTMIALAAFFAAGMAHAEVDGGLSFGDNDFEDSPFSIIPQFGMTISNIHMNEVPWGDMDSKAGFNVGVHAQYYLPGCYGVYINGGLDYSMKGAKDRIEAGPGGAIGATAIARPMYLSVPIHVGYHYKPDALESVGFYGDFGPYFALGTNGKYLIKLDDYSDDISTNFFMKENNGFYKVQRPEFGLGFRLGAEYLDRYNLILSFDWGVTDMLTQSQKHTLVSNELLGITNPTMRNFSVGLTFACRFSDFGQ